MVSGDPAPHVQPLSRPFGWWAVLSVQQHQLLLSTNCTALQHPLQLQVEKSSEKQVASTQFITEIHCINEVSQIL